MDETKENLPEIVEHGIKRTATVQRRAMGKKLKLENQNGQVWGKERSHWFLQPNVNYVDESVRVEDLENSQRLRDGKERI